MTDFPTPNFPLSQSDQADVIRLFVQLMNDWERAGRPSALTAQDRMRRRGDGHDAEDPGDLRDGE